MLQNKRVISVGYGMCYRTHRGVGYRAMTATKLTEVLEYCIQNRRVISVGYRMYYRTSRKCRLLWCNRHKPHRSVGYCGATVTELTEEVLGYCTQNRRVTSVGYRMCYRIFLFFSTSGGWGKIKL